MSDANENKIVKLESLIIVDFKKLKKGKISWNYQPNDMLGAIGVTDFYGMWIFVNIQILLTHKQMEVLHSFVNFIYAQNNQRYFKRLNLDLAMEPMLKMQKSLWHYM